MFQFYEDQAGLTPSSRFANKGAYRVVKQFAEEMWRKGGIQLVILAGYEDDQGEIFSQT